MKTLKKEVFIEEAIESYLCLITCYLLEYMEDWANDSAYIKADKLGPVIEQEERLVAN